MKKVTMIDIAERAGVSKATVSMVINKRDEGISEGTRSRILAIAEELNYIPNSIARSLSTKKSETIGIVLPDITNPFFSEMARAIEDGASNLGYNVIFCNTDNEIKKEEKYTKLLISKLMDGVIFIAGGRSVSSLQTLKSNNIPFVLVDRYVEGYEDLYGVYCLNEKGVVDGIDFLYKKKKRNIAFVKGANEVEISNQRFQGYKKAMTQYGLYKEQLVFQGDFNIDGGMAATKMIIEGKEKIDAIFYSNDVMAFGGMKVLVKNGYKVPEDISIMGFDNVQVSQFIEPELTTISQPIYDMGIQSCKLLVKLIKGEIVEEKQIYFEPELVIRGTT